MNLSDLNNAVDPSKDVKIVEFDTSTNLDLTINHHFILAPESDNLSVNVPNMSNEAIYASFNNPSNFNIILNLGSVGAYLIESKKTLFAYWNKSCWMISMNHPIAISGDSSFEKSLMPEFNHVEKENNAINITNTSYTWNIQRIIPLKDSSKTFAFLSRSDGSNLYYGYGFGDWSEIEFISTISMSFPTAIVDADYINDEFVVVLIRSHDTVYHNYFLNIVICRKDGQNCYYYNGSDPWLHDYFSTSDENFNIIEPKLKIINKNEPIYENIRFCVYANIAPKINSTSGTYVDFASDDFKERIYSFKYDYYQNLLSQAGNFYHTWLNLTPANHLEYDFCVNTYPDFVHRLHPYNVNCSHSGSWDQYKVKALALKTFINNFQISDFEPSNESVANKDILDFYIGYGFFFGKKEIGSNFVFQETLSMNQKDLDSTYYNVLERQLIFKNGNSILYHINDINETNHSYYTNLIYSKVKNTIAQDSVFDIIHSDTSDTILPSIRENIRFFKIDEDNEVCGVIYNDYFNHGYLTFQMFYFNQTENRFEYSQKIVLDTSVTGMFDYHFYKMGDEYYMLEIGNYRYHLTIV